MLIQKQLAERSNTLIKAYLLTFLYRCLNPLSNRKSEHISLGSTILSPFISVSIYIIYYTTFLQKMQLFLMSFFYSQYHSTISAVQNLHNYKKSPENSEDFSLYKYFFILLRLAEIGSILHFFESAVNPVKFKVQRKVRL